MGGTLLGWRTVCAVEINPKARRTLLDRQRDNVLPRFPIWDDIKTFDGCAWRGYVDVISGGFPCIDISSAGKRAGIEGEHSSLWMDMARIIREVRPHYAFVENASSLTARGLGTVLRDLAEMRMDARWGVLGANDCGLPHRRKRMWLVAYPQRSQCGQESYGRSIGRVGRIIKPVSWDRDWLAIFTGARGTRDGVARNVDRTDTIRNGQVPAVAANAFRILQPY